MSIFERGGAAVALTSVLFGCSPATNSGNAPAKSEPAYTRIDENTFLIDGNNPDLNTRLPENLAQFRREVAGDFILILDDSRYALNDDALAIRREVPVGETTNRIVDVQGGTAGK